MKLMEWIATHEYISRVQYIKLELMIIGRLLTSRTELWLIADTGGGGRL